MGGKYVLDSGLTLWGYCKTHFYRLLEKYNPDLVKKYDVLYGDSKFFSEYTAQVHEQVLKYCRKYDITPYIPRPVNFFPEEMRINKEIAGKLYLEARELQMSSRGSYKEWAYRKAAWTIDDLKESIEKIYQDKGIDGIMEVQGIGEKLANKIEELLHGVMGK